ncbi:MAG TPA: hypothetical protein DEF04_02225 [Clostridiales bacterium]|nr:hypothetical protein [Clostridiales bacterium]
MMEEKIESKKAKLLIAIIDRGKGEKLTEFFRENKVVYNLIALGKGTAKSELLDYLGLGQTEKDIVISVMYEESVQNIMGILKDKIHLKEPGNGVAFTIPIGSVDSNQALEYICFLSDDERGGKMEERINEKIEERNDEYKEFDLIITIVNRGFDDVVMDAARESGATGGTVLHARGAGIHEAEKFFGISIQPEKDVILILARREDKKQIMHAIRNEVGLNKEGRGLSFSMPVEDVCGIVHMNLDFKK